MIAGAEYKRLQPHDDQRGWLAEIVRSDDPHFDQFGQVYMSVTYPDVVKAWHLHRAQVDNMAAIHGMVKLVLYDGRPGSSTHGRINEIFMGLHNPVLVQIPAGVFHGFKGIGTQEALVINFPSQPYRPDDPDEHRLSPDHSSIPYDWAREDR